MLLRDGSILPHQFSAIDGQALIVALATAVPLCHADGAEAEGKVLKGGRGLPRQVP